MLDPHSHGEGLRLHGYLKTFQCREGISRAVADGQDHRLRGDLLQGAVLPPAFQSADRPGSIRHEALHPRVKADLASQLQKPLPQLSHDGLQHIGPDVRFVPVENGGIRPVLHKPGDEL